MNACGAYLNSVTPTILMGDESAFVVYYTMMKNRETSVAMGRMLCADENVSDVHE